MWWQRAVVRNGHDMLAVKAVEIRLPTQAVGANRPKLNVIPDFDICGEIDSGRQLVGRVAGWSE